MFAAALSVSLLTVALVTGASATLTRRLWARTPWLAPAYGLLGLGLTAHLAWMLCWWSRMACVVFAIGVVISSAAVLVTSRCWVSWRTWTPLAALSTSVLAMAVGHGFLWGWLHEPFLTAALRYGALPGDNILQYKFAHHLWNDLSTVLFYSDWNGSDRPPLQSGILLLTRPLETLLGVPSGAGYEDLHGLQWGLGASIVAQLIWVPGLYALLRALRFRPGVAALTIAFVSVLPLAVWNTTFTWPKMMSAGLALAALAILVTLLLDRPERVAVPIAAAGALVVLAFLTHGAAAFVAPAPVFLALLALRGRGGRRFLGNAALNLGVAGLLYLPWTLYSKYADPNHARLLKWHFAGVIPPDERSFLPTLVDAYRDASLSQLIDVRRENLTRVFDLRFGDRFHPGASWPDPWRAQDFFSSTFAIGLGSLLGVCWLAVWLVGLSRRRAHSPEVGVSVLVGLSCLACMLLWSLVLFLPDGATVHVGTFVWLLVFAAIPFAWTASRSVPLAVVVVVLQAAYAAVVYHDPHPQFATFREPELSGTYAAVMGAGVLGLVACTAVMLVADRRAARGGGPPSSGAPGQDALSTTS